MAWWCKHSPSHPMLKEHADHEEDGSSDGQGSSYFSGEVIDRGNSLRSHVWLLCTGYACIMNFDARVYRCQLEPVLAGLS